MTIKPEMTCPTCGYHDISKNGTTRRGKQNYKCRDCGRQFVEDPQWKPKDKTDFALIDLLLLEKLSLADIARVTDVSESWLQAYFNNAYADMPRNAVVFPKAQGKLKVQMDELWSFVDEKGSKQWVWIALDVDTREIVGCYVGDRSRSAATALWQSMPSVYRQCAVVYTDYWERCDPASLCGARECAPRQAYETVIPRKRHFAVSKESGLTRYIERLNNTLRQRVSRLVRKTLSFSKKIENHIGAIWLFIHEYNCIIQEKLSERTCPTFSSVLY